MANFDDYLAMYAQREDVLRSAFDGRLAPQAHFERLFNSPFPELRTGLNGLGAVGAPMTNPGATLLHGSLVPSPVWLQRALNARLAAGGRLTVDGQAGANTLSAANLVWNQWRARPEAVAERALAKRQDPDSHAAAPYAAQGSVAIERAFLNYLMQGVQVEDPAGSPCPADAVTAAQCRRPNPGQGVDPNDPALNPEPPTSSATPYVLGALAIGFGIWLAKRR